MTFEEMDRLVDERINGAPSPVYTKAAEIMGDLSAQIISLLQQIYDLKEENATLKSLLETYKAKADLVIELSADKEVRKLELVK